MADEPNPVAAPAPGDAPAPVAVPDPAPAGTIAEGAPPPVGDQPAAPAAPPSTTWPDDWRTRLAGGDEKMAQRLGRFSDPAAMWTSYRALEQKLSERDVKKELPKGATPEQVAAWRKDNGIPEAPDGYKPDLPDGVVLGEADKPLVDSFAKYAHESNMPPAHFNAALKWYYSTLDAQKAASDEADVTFRSTSEEALRADWGGNFGPNRNAIQNMIAGWPQEARNKLLNGRTADGRKIGDDPDVLRLLAAQALELNPAATVIPSGGDQAKSIEDEINEIKKIRQTDERKYWSKEIQERERTLIDAQLKLKSRAA